MSPCVLIVDDHQRVRDALQMVVELEGYEVDTAADGPQALERIAARRPDVMLINLHLGAMPAWTLLDELRRLGLNVPAIFMSFHGGVGRLADEHSAAGSLPMPFTPDELLSTLATITHLTPRAAA